MDDDHPRRRSAGLHEPGRLIDAYKLVRPLGRGGMAEVWIAKSVGAGRAEKHVALKFMAAHLAQDKRYRKQFRVEAEVAVMLNHTNIVQVFGFNETHEIPYIVMEWVDGINLRKVRDSLAVASADRRIRIACYVVEQLLHALRYAHSIVTDHGREVGLVHRDVTPQNVLVSNSGEVKLTDFGVVATSFDETSGLYAKGKLRYMAPEQLAGHSREKTVDLYATGAIFHELLEGERYRGDTEDERELYAEVLEGEIPETTTELPEEVEELRSGLLEPDPAYRIQTADEALDYLCMVSREGDPRRDLMRLCTGLTGIFVPRSGPGPSPLHGMARSRRGPRRSVGSRRPGVAGSGAGAGAQASNEREVAREHEPRSISRANETPAAEVSVTKRQDFEPVLASGNERPEATRAPAASGVANAEPPHPSRERTVPGAYGSQAPAAPAPVVPPVPTSNHWDLNDSASSNPVELEATAHGYGDVSGARAGSSAGEQATTGLAPLLVVAALVLIATSVMVTVLLTKQDVVTTTGAMSGTKAVEILRPPPLAQLPSHDDDKPDEPSKRVTPPAQLDPGAASNDDDAGGGSEATNPDRDTVSPNDRTTRAGDEIPNAQSAPSEPESPPKAPPRPTLTIRVARKYIGPLWVWVEGRSAPHRIDNPPYKVISNVPERSTVRWNTTKTKKGAQRQKVGKRKKNKIWNLVIKEADTETFYLDE